MNQFDEEDDDRVSELNQDNLFTQETYEKIILDKNGQPSKYHSFWECDDDDIEEWTKVIIN